MPSFIGLLSGHPSFPATKPKTCIDDTITALPFLPLDAVELEALVLQMNVRTCVSRYLKNCCLVVW
jgi:hypothetical protein